MKKRNNLFRTVGSTILVTTPILTVVSCGAKPYSTGLYSQGRRTLITHVDANSKSVFTGELKSAWDLSIVERSPIYHEFLSPTIPSIIRQTVTQNSSISFNKDGTINQDKNKKTETNFDIINSASFIDSHGTQQKYSNWNNFETNLDLNPSKEFIFEVPNGVHYINNKGEKSQYELKGKDLFYGFMRLIYSNDDIRQFGESDVQGVYGDNLNPFSNQYANSLLDDYYSWNNDKDPNHDKKMFGKKYSLNGKKKPYWKSKNFVNSPNIYLLGANLFDIDFDKTIEKNLSPLAGSYEFHIVMKEKNNSLFIKSLFSGSYTIPVPSEKIINDSNLSTLSDFKSSPGKFLQWNEFGTSKKKHGLYDLSNELTIGRYYISNYDSNAGSKGFVIEQNPFSYDKDWLKLDNTILKFQILPYSSGDPDAQQQAWAKSFRNDENSESFLYKEVLKNPSLLNEINKDNSSKWVSSSTSGMINSLAFNPEYMIKGKKQIDENMSKILFGTNKSDVLNNSDADDQYFFGRGKRFRRLLNSSVNLYSLYKEWKPSSSANAKTNALWAPGQAFDFNNNVSQKGVNYSYGYGVSNYLEQSNNYIESLNKDPNNVNWIDTYVPSSLSEKSTYIKNIKNEFIKLVKESGLKNSDKKTFYLYDLFPNDKNMNLTTINAYNHLIEYLNSLTSDSGIEIKSFLENQDDNESTSSMEISTINSSSPLFRFISGGDYLGISSVLQQTFSAYWGFGFLTQFIHEIYKDPHYLVSELKEGDGRVNGDYSAQQTEKLDFSHFINYLETELTKLENQEIASARKNGNTPNPNITILHIVNELKNGSSTINDFLNFKRQTNNNKENIYVILNNIFLSYMFKEVSSKNKPIEIQKWNRVLMNSHISNNLILGDERYSSTSSVSAVVKNPTALNQNINIDIEKIYSQPWLHLGGQQVLQPVNGINLIDTRVDLN
ncbi:MAG: hypothetical protein K4H23_05065 [Mollicutes bacterium PWAP]|nr:hypothetical protein [Mollicutes bacterium PWAP]